jgi:hypothetical protein
MGIAALMITWKLSRALKKQSVNQRTFWPLLPTPVDYTHWGCLIVIFGAIFFFAGAQLNPNFLSVCLNGGALLVAGMMSVANGCIQGARTALRIGGLLARVRERGQYDLLCLLPAGAARINWTLSTAYLHRSQTFSILSSELIWVVRSIFILATVLIIARQSRNPWQGPFLAITQIALLYAAFYIDDIQSLIVGSLVGMIAPTAVRTPADARVYSLMGYLLIQLTTYLLVVLGAFVALPAVYRSLQFSGLLADILQFSLGLALLYGIREIIIRILWGRLMQRLDIYPADILTISD